MGEGKLRNLRCSCGSGKKYKNCCLGKKPRQVSVTMDMGKVVSMDGVRMGKNGTIEMLYKGEPLTAQSAYIETSYERPTKRKVLNRIKLKKAELRTDLHGALIQYDRVFAIDTNTRNIRGDSVAVTGVVLCRFVRENGSFFAEYAAINCLELRNVKGSPERVAWRKSIELIMADPSYDPKLQVGLIVDSDLGNMNQYNEREKPIYGNFHLPENFDLIYASSDVGKEYLPNKLISLCDKEATSLLGHIASSVGKNENLVETQDMPYTHFRLWRK